MSKNNKTVDRIQAVWNIIGGEEGADRLINGETMIVGGLAKKIWNKIRVGTFKNVDEIRKALKKANMEVSHWASDILNNVILNTKEEEFELVNVSPAELGFEYITQHKDIYDQARKSGLEPCSSEDGPQAALQLGGQLKNGERFLIGMEPILDSDGDPLVFSIERKDIGEIWLYSDDGNPDNFWDIDVRFVFRRCKSK